MGVSLFSSDIGEKSCELVTVSDAGAVSIETIPTSVLLWSEIEIDASDCQTAYDLDDKLPALFRQLVFRESRTCHRVKGAHRRQLRSSHGA